MNNTKPKPSHTPGPWRIGNSKSMIVADSAENITINGATDESSVQYYGGNLIAESVAPANSKLIAAAPDLLQTLQTCVNYLISLESLDGSNMPFGWDDDFINNLKISIKKATE